MNIMKWLRRILKLSEPIPYHKLAMGFVTEYSIIIPKSKREQFIGDGWYEAEGFHDFHYRPNEDEMVLLSTPRTLAEVGVSSLVGQTITAFATHYGSYGMGGPGFLGLTLSDLPEAHKVMVYAVWSAGQYTLLP